MKKLLLLILLMPIHSWGACETFQELGDSLCLGNRYVSAETLRAENKHVLNGFQATWIKDRCFIRRNNITLISKSTDDKGKLQYFWVQGRGSTFLQNLVIERLSEVCLNLNALTALEKQKAERKQRQDQIDTIKKALL
ncbi:MAG: hypothetical protein A2X86_09310 [Bdellovibrionales bacterium GWA2_49_15]|nr:MAG: hypothetical protein A2X86_09310 [Bdellovibrionales bacterium GWA2_49_15]HAZ12976.1 hypothetical protein [Bdellovibrionales bacterium]